MPNLVNFFLFQIFLFQIIFPVHGRVRPPVVLRRALTGRHPWRPSSSPRATACAYPGLTSGASPTARTRSRRKERTRPRAVKPCRVSIDASSRSRLFRPRPRRRLFGSAPRSLSSRRALRPRHRPRHRRRRPRRPGSPRRTNRRRRRRRRRRPPPRTASSSPPPKSLPPKS